MRGCGTSCGTCQGRWWPLANRRTRWSSAFVDIVPVDVAYRWMRRCPWRQRRAVTGDIVLLSPACASFDWFNNYEHRGRVFKEIVRRSSRSMTHVDIQSQKNHIDTDHADRGAGPDGDQRRRRVQRELHLGAASSGARADDCSAVMRQRSSDSSSCSSTMQVDYHKLKKCLKARSYGRGAAARRHPGPGWRLNGAARWLRIGGFGFQPSEFARLALIIHLAVLCRSAENSCGISRPGICPLMFWIVVVTVLVLVQPGFSTGSMIFVVSIIMLFLGGVQWSHLGLTLSAVIPVLLAYMVSAEYRMRRVMEFRRQRASVKPGPG